MPSKNGIIHNPLDCGHNNPHTKFFCLPDRGPMIVAPEIHPCPSPRQSVLQKSPVLSILKEDRALGLLINLQKQGHIPKPEVTEILHPSSCADDSAFRDETSSPTRRRRLICRWLIPLCTMNKSASGLMPGDGGKIPWLLCLRYISICQAFSGIRGKMSQQFVDTMDLVSSCGFWCESFIMLHTLPPHQP